MVVVESTAKIESRNDFPLRGFVICPQCGKLLTGSKSKGRHKYYTYYHCFQGCSYRINTEKLMHFFVLELRKYIPKKEIITIYHSILVETYYELTKDIQISKKQTLVQIKEFENRMSHIRDLLATDKIDASDYHDIKAQYKGSIEQLNEKLVILGGKVPDINKLLHQGIEAFLQLDKVLKDGNSEDFRAIVNMLFPEKIKPFENGIEYSKLENILKLSYYYND